MLNSHPESMSDCLKSCLFRYQKPQGYTGLAKKLFKNKGRQTLVYIIVWFGKDFRDYMSVNSAH